MRFVAPAKLGASAHARARRKGNRTCLEIAGQHTGVEQLDALRAFDVPFDLAADDHGIRADAARELGAGVDREIALDMDVALKRPARRMCPAPSILPSMVMSEAMIDSAGSPRCTLRRVELEIGDGVGTESSDVSVCL